ncbi:hypothetical protein BCR36DRAFT_333203 [Piromyces finnis]|uniref:Cellulase n=1 Tax=Piromyces finnis TaxID=1754191 RepID=A0A1Y1V1Y2_9FUNG|nr:hypothetical protein BCR36DRAFT_333203 [Piromyces finnis]|eukprot:ORX45391.1 hypothetical protein BCR36DRAFT_333203 [Piromyces finnis]
MKITTKSILSMVALLSIGVVDGKKITKCAIKPKITASSIPTTLITNDAINDEPITLVEDITTEGKTPISSSIKNEPIEPISTTSKESVAITTIRPIPVTSAAAATTTTTITTTTTVAEKKETSVLDSDANSTHGLFVSLPEVTKGETGRTTRYWDCCLASCAWKENTGGPVVNACEIDGKTLIKNFDYTYGNVCAGGKGFMCNNNQPWEINEDIAFGFAAASFSKGSQADWCCSCYRLQFTSEEVKGKQMIVQITNTGTDLSDNHFDIQIPGGGVGIFNGCQKQWNSPADGWGQRSGGINSRSDCSNLPKELQDGCYWRFDWFKNADNPAVTFERVQCPVELTSKSGCVPLDNDKYKKIPWN